MSAEAKAAEAPKIRKVIRVLIYEGTEEWIQKGLQRRYVRGRVEMPGSGDSAPATITEQFYKYEGLEWLRGGLMSSEESAELWLKEEA